MLFWYLDDPRQLARKLLPESWFPILEQLLTIIRHRCCQLQKERRASRHDPTGNKFSQRVTSTWAQLYTCINPREENVTWHQMPGNWSSNGFLNVRTRRYIIQTIMPLILQKVNFLSISRRSITLGAIFRWRIPVYHWPSGSREEPAMLQQSASHHAVCINFSKKGPARRKILCPMPPLLWTASDGHPILESILLKKVQLLKR